MGIYYELKMYLEKETFIYAIQRICLSSMTITIHGRQNGIFENYDTTLLEV